MSSTSKRSVRWLLLISSLLAVWLAFSLVVPAAAVEFTQDGVIAADEVINDDLFISADKVTIEGTVNGALFINRMNCVFNGVVNGNLIVNSGEMLLNGEVNGSLIFVGQSAHINGPVNGTIYAASASFLMDEKATIKRNMFYAGFSLETKPASVVGIDLMMTGYQAFLNGEVGRDANFDGAGLEVAGNIGRNLTAKVDAPEDGSGLVFQGMPFLQGPGAPQRVSDGGILIAPEAQIGGFLSYTSPLDQADAIQAVPAGGVKFSLPEVKLKARVTARQQFAAWILAQIQIAITLAILGSLAVWLAPDLLRRCSSQARAKPLPSAGWGLVTLAGGFAGFWLLALLIIIGGILVAVVSLGGLAKVVFGIGLTGLALAFTLFMFMIVYGSKLIVAYLFGRLLLERLAPDWVEYAWRVLGVGLLIYIPLASIPILGWLVSFLATLVGLGAAWLLWRASRRSPPAGLPAMPEADAATDAIAA